MSYADIDLKTQVNGSGIDRSVIIGIMQDAYTNSPAFQTMFDSYIATGGNVVINYVPGAAQGKFTINTTTGVTSPLGIVDLDPAVVEAGIYISPTGKAVNDTLRSGFLHELGHALGARGDWHAIAGVPTPAPLPYYTSEDYMGDNVRYVNQIFHDLGIAEQVSYIAYGSSGELVSGFEYTEGNTIVGAVLADNANIDIKTLASADLLVGDAGANTEWSGAGNDYIYGEGGSDTLSGGAGNDFIDGSGPISHNQDGIDTVDYGIGNTSIVINSGVESVIAAQTPAGIDLNLDYNTTNLVDSRKVFVATNDGYGGTDRLVSVEKIIGTAHDDTFRVSGVIDTADRVQIVGNGADTHDTIDLSSSNVGYHVDLNAAGTGSIFAVDSGGTKTGDTITLNGVAASIVGSAHNDLLNSAVSDTTLNGGAGNDLIQARSATALSLGGDGSDRILVFNGATVDGGAGNDIYKIEGAPGTIKFGAGSGNEVVEGNAIIDFGTLSMSDVSLSWNYSTSGVEDQDPDSGIWHKQYDGAVELVLSSGDSIRVLGDTLHAWSVGSGPGGDYSDAFVNLTLDLSFSEFKFADGTVNLWDLLWDNGYFAVTTVDLGDGHTIDLSSVAKPLAGTAVHEAPNDLAWVSDFFGQSPVTPTGPNEQAYASAGDDLFYQGGASYSSAGSNVIASLRSSGTAQETGGSGHDVLVDVTELDGSAYADTLTAGYTATTVHGGDGDDIILNAGLSGVDAGSALYGDGGDDTFSITVKGNTVDGGSGSDTVQFDQALSAYAFLRTADGGVQVTSGGATDVFHDVEWAAFADVTTPVALNSLVSDYGTEGDDSLLSGTDGRDSLFGLGGDDTILPGAGTDHVDGGDGYDQVNYLADSADFAFMRNADGSVSVAYDSGSAVDDRGVLVNVEAVYFEGDSQWHSIAELAGDYGTAGDDAAVLGTGGADHLYGLAGDDVLIGYQGDDLIDGGDGYDQVNYDGSLSDFSFVRNADGSVTVTDFVGNEGTDTVVSADAFYFAGSSDWRASNDLVADYGTADSDPWINGTAGGDNVYGLAGDDTLVGNGGNDQLFGGDGYDQANYFGSSSQFTFMLNADGTVTVTDTGGDEGMDVLSSVEALYFQGDDIWMTVDDALGSSSANSYRAETNDLHSNNDWMTAEEMFATPSAHAFEQDYAYL